MPNDLPRGRNRNNSSVHAGVSYNPMSRKWQAQITYHKVYHYIGLFNTAFEAGYARNKFEKKLRRLDAGLAA